VTQSEPEPRFVTSPDGTPIAVFASGHGPPLVLIHGAAADHTTFRVVGPMLERTFTVHAMDRRGRGSSGDGAAYAVEREFEDVAAVAEAIAAESESGAPVPVVGHSFGGRTALGAALRTPSIGSVVCYEGAPSAPGRTYQPPGAEDRVRDRLEAGDRDGALATFMTEIAGLSRDDLARYREDPIWPRRVAAAHTVLRELHAEADPAASLEALGRVTQPVLQILGGASIAEFRDATHALAEHLADGHLDVIDGARHSAHHTHPDAFVAAIEAFLRG